jgi:predicted Fe-Mo cluster-binding NifX family protein
MKIVMPVKMNKEDSAISPLFGHAKYFAFIEDDKISIEKNPFDGGIDVIRWLLEEGVNIVITQHIGLKPFLILKEHNVKCYFPGEGRVTIKEALEKLKSGDIEEINEGNIERFLRHKHH